MTVAVSACQAPGDAAREGTTHPADTAQATEALPRPLPSDTPRIALRLVDSIPYATEAAEGVLHHVEVSTGQHVDTLRGLRTRLPPVASGDSLVYGFLFDSLGGLTHVFRISLKPRRVDSMPLPTDLNPAVSEPALAPDATHIAYVAFDSMARGVVRRWPDLVAILETPRLEYSPGDMLAGAVEWRGRDAFMIYIDPFNDGSNRWVRFHGRLGSSHLAVDTIQVGDQP